MSQKKKKTSLQTGELVVCNNAKARHNYHIEERMEAGMALVGSEVKSLRMRQGNLDGAYATIDSGEVFLHKMNIASYEHATVFGHEPKRSRKLLLHRRQIERLIGKLAVRGFTLIPLRVYFKNGRAKVELGLAKGLKTGDTREDIKRRIDLREARSAMGKGRR
ncbi:MAG: SsrA-binding protein SmpB [Deltaproteobacteria bacterium]|nr:SsrA-binding protein SmpB [Deltaproteobacteria bacterium]